ncbi:hypothetical protein DAPPUDRAFT_328621 [Daphnia pulex]|uniref:Uncharacterized protein n=1 Tax=Daphnia pulex TaxID=6669 RepID=E9HE92_DAPPU|nr:hypothetical protein DAPPUDRAFT_328622 [Daphnia pulex]EFX69938.1 hypothetical protein DAPPUDRAFT_328621 [Daphnia pulex]|eukprot:EFX69937.1 hypothetical protein DAPPUDRAFT_328622 [Daphnia pulex]
MTKVMLITLTLVALVCAEELKAEGRQMNWSNLNFASKPAYQQSSYGSDSSDSNGSPSVQNAQAKSSGSYQGLVSQSLDGQDINRDGSYSAPSSYGSNNDYGYEASPDSSYGNAVGYGDDKHSSFVSALTAFLPIGLFLAAIVPNIVTVSAGRRKRSEAGTKEEAKAAVDEATFPILDMISSFGVRSLQEPSCQSKIVCEIGRMGGLPEANAVQRALWFTANYVPERVSNLIGADKLFRQIRSQQCSEFMCSSD